MSFVSTRKGRTVIGNRRMTFGNFTNADGTTSGTIKTGLTQTIESISIALDSDSTGTTVPRTAEVPASGPDIAVVTSGTLKGRWFAVGR